VRGEPCYTHRAPLWYSDPPPFIFFSFCLSFSSLWCLVSVLKIKNFVYLGAILLLSTDCASCVWERYWGQPLPCFVLFYCEIMIGGRLTLFLWTLKNSQSTASLTPLLTLTKECEIQGAVSTAPKKITKERTQVLSYPYPSSADIGKTLESRAPNRSAI